tara:strand:- start:3697 stop:4077 length:381 start_codon:yes stop_codon:yes gene_type:complete
MDIKTVLISSVVLFLIDSLFLSLISKKYSKMIEKIQGKPMKVRVISAIVSYLILIFSVNYFILNDETKKPIDALFLGWSIYGVYDATAYAIIDKWDISMALMDAFWGGILFLSSTIATRHISKIFT